jgi:hypothetical protein
MINTANAPAVVIAGLITIIMTGANTFGFVVSGTTSNQTGIVTASTSNSTASGGEDSQGKLHLGVAIGALQSGDKDGAMMHMNEADKTLTGAAKLHLGVAIGALQSGDKDGAMMHLQESKKFP